MFFPNQSLCHTKVQVDLNFPWERVRKATAFHSPDIILSHRFFSNYTHSMQTDVQNNTTNHPSFVDLAFQAIKINASCLAVHAMQKISLFSALSQPCDGLCCIWLLVLFSLFSRMVHVRIFLHHRAAPW